MGNQSRVHIIAEAGVNHNGSLDMAIQLVDVAAEAGADVVKFQTFKAGKLVSKSAAKADYQIRNTGEIESQFDMLKKLELDEAAHRALAQRCIKRKIQFLSTPFDLESLNMLVAEFDPPYIKIPSGEITNAPFLLDIAKTGKPVILSTGMSTLGEVEMALSVLAYGYIDDYHASPSLSLFEKAYFSTEGRAAIVNNVTLLHCTTEYPAPFHDVNLRAMETLKKAFGLPVGYSDHTVGIVIPIAAVALGAVVVEKHFTLDRKLPGPDHKASLEPHELKEMVASIRHVEVAMGSALKQPSPSELENRLIGRKSLVAASLIRKGDKFSPESLTVKRSGNGISPMLYWDWLEREAMRDYFPDDMVQP